VKCDRLPYIQYDYFGQPRPPDKPCTVGPIQNLPKLAGGEQPVTIELWPNVPPPRPPVAEMRINIQPLPVVAKPDKE
jgi:hypothetical protein